jgi:hypothetical protein
MPKPHPGIKYVLDYLRDRWPHEEDFTDQYTGKSFTAKEIYEALKRIEKTDPGISSVMYYWYRSRASKGDIASAKGVDPSTIKRRLNDGINMLLVDLHYPDLEKSAHCEKINLYPWLDDND